MDKLKMKIKKLTYEQCICRCIFLVEIFLSRILPYYALKFKAENYQPQKKYGFQDANCQAVYS